MSSTPIAAVPPERRVREQARDAAALMGFSLAISMAFAIGLLLLASVGR